MQNTPGAGLWESPGVLLRGTMPGGAPWIQMSAEPCYWQAQLGELESKSGSYRNCSSWQTEYLRFTQRKFLEGTQRPNNTYLIHHTEWELKSFPKGVWHGSLGEKIREVRQICEHSLLRKKLSIKETAESERGITAYFIRINKVDVYDLY